MKKILIVSILLLIGCGRAPIHNNYPSKPTIIYSIEKIGPRDCMYYVNGSPGMFALYSTGWFIDKCGLYTVGDTVYISKKPKKISRIQFQDQYFKRLKEKNHYIADFKYYC